MSTSSSLTILIATYNRSSLLERTLEEFTRLDTRGLRVQYVIVDNNSNDDTPRVVESFAERLPVRYLFEPRAGKNCALNKALNDVELGDLVVFTDDDIVPRGDWLQQMVQAAQAYPDCSIFGGQVYLIWPDGHQPGWAEDCPALLSLLGHHDAGDESHLYEPGYFPFGANLWVRREIFERGYRYHENIGPRPKNRLMGSETTFLQRLADDGWAMRYWPEAVIGHILMPSMVSVSGLFKRAFRYGRSEPHVMGMPQRELLHRSPILWQIEQVIALVRNSVKLVKSMFQSTWDKRIQYGHHDLIRIGRAWEALRIFHRRTTLAVGPDD